MLTVLGILSACSNDEKSSDDMDITKDYVMKNAKEGLSAKEVKEVFGEPLLADTVDSTETWLYSTPADDTDYKPSLEAVNHQAILDEVVDYELYINFLDNKAYIYSYFYKSGEDVREYKVLPDGAEPSDMQVTTFD